MTNAKLVVRGGPTAQPTTRDVQVRRILANKANLFTAAELRTWSTTQLGKLEQMLSQADEWEAYTGPAGAAQVKPLGLITNEVDNPSDWEPYKAPCGCATPARSVANSIDLDSDWESYVAPTH